VVDPRIGESSHGTYPTLEQAVVAAPPGATTIRIRHNGELPVKPIRLEDATDLTIKAEPNFHPILTLGETREPDTALFRLQDGRVTFKDLEFLLKPNRDEFTAQSLLALTGEGRASLIHCAVTLQKAGRDQTNLALATLPDAGKVMRTADVAPRQGPRLMLDGCLVRGEGDLVWSRSGRPFELEVKNSLAVLNGSLLDLGANATGSAAPVGQKVSVHLAQLTTCLNGNLIRLQAGKDIKGLLPVQCRASDCLFLPPAGGSRSLIHLDGPETEEKVLKEKVQWEGNHNAYGNFTVMLYQQPPVEGMALPIPTERWKTFSGESNSNFNVSSNLAPPLDTFLQVLPSQFKLPEDLAGYGADPGQLPTPTRKGSDSP